MTPEEFRDITLNEFASFDAVLEANRLDREVPTCPGWTLGTLGWHVSQTYEWMTAALTGTTEPPDPDHAVPDDTELLHVLRATSSTLFTALGSADPKLPCWTMAPPHRAGFWIRRAAHETAVHRWDAQTAVGTADPILPALAADGVAEVEDMFLPRQIKLGRQRPLTRSLEFHFTDVAAAPVVLGPTDSATQRRSRTTITGQAEKLLLLLWKRIRLDDADVEITGDPDVAKSVLEAALTP